MVDVTYHLIDLGGEGNWFSGHMHEVSVLRTKMGVVTALTMSVWQAVPLTVNAR
jgi:hypothetical protein